MAEPELSAGGGQPGAEDAGRPDWLEVASHDVEQLAGGIPIASCVVDRCQREPGERGDRCVVASLGELDGGFGIGDGAVEVAVGLADLGTCRVRTGQVGGADAVLRGGGERRVGPPLCVGQVVLLERVHGQVRLTQHRRVRDAGTAGDVVRVVERILCRFTEPEPGHCVQPGHRGAGAFGQRNRRRCGERRSASFELAPQQRGVGAQQIGLPGAVIDPSGHGASSEEVRGVVAHAVDRVEVTLDDADPCPEQVCLDGVVCGRWWWQSAVPAADRCVLAGVEQCQAVLDDGAVRQLGVARVECVLDGRDDGTAFQVCACGATVGAGGGVAAGAFELEQQPLAEQVVVAVSAGALIERHEELVGASQVDEPPAAARRVEHRVAQLAVELMQH